MHCLPAFHDTETKVGQARSPRTSASPTGSRSPTRCSSPRQRRLRPGREPHAHDQGDPGRDAGGLSHAHRRRPRRQRAAAARRADDRREPARATSASRPRRWRRSRRSTSWSITHGNGPQVGLLALQGAAYNQVRAYPLDVLGAQTEGMIGYMIEQELGNLLPFERAVRHPPDHGRGRSRRSRPSRTRPSSSARSTTKAEAERLAAREGLGRQAGRRQVAARRRLAAAEADLRDPPDQVAAGAGHHRDRRRRRRHPDDVRAGHRPQLVGVECVIDKDLAPRSWRASSRPTSSSWPPTPTRSISTGASRPAGDPPRQPGRPGRHAFPAGSMGPKVEAALDFARATGRTRRSSRPRRRARGGARREGHDNRRDAESRPDRFIEAPMSHRPARSPQVLQARGPPAPGPHVDECWRIRRQNNEFTGRN